MNEEYKADGKAHPLSGELGYILHKKDDLFDMDLTEDLKSECTKEYCKYLLEVDKEKVISYLIDYIQKNIPEDISYIFRPSYLNNNISLQASFALKFKRSPNDESFFKDDQ